MKKEEQLHQLIQALTPAEKKYIRININKFRPEEDNKNTLLFDSLNQQKKYTAAISEKAYKSAGYTSDQTMQRLMRLHLTCRQQMSMLEINWF